MIGIVSNASSRRDRVAKREEYAAADGTEY
jgi:hypothetical protein